MTNTVDASFSLPVRRPSLARFLAAIPLAAIASFAAPGIAQDEAPKRQPLRVLYVGNEGSERAASYRDFLAQHFEVARTSARDGFDAATAGGFDVVLLDWSQRDVDIMKMRELRSPLGPREAWRKPLVLLGSAGLLLGGTWNLVGTYG